MRAMSEIVRDQKPLTLGPAETVKHACECMRERRVGAVLVIEGDRRVIGIFTGRDAVCRVLAERRDPAVTRLAEVMTRDPATRCSTGSLSRLHSRPSRSLNPPCAPPRPVCRRR